MFNSCILSEYRYKPSPFVLALRGIATTTQAAARHAIATNVVARHRNLNRGIFVKICKLDARKEASSVGLPRSSRKQGRVNALSKSAFEVEQ
jgi:hypothetical protein